MSDHPEFAAESANEAPTAEMVEQAPSQPAPQPAAAIPAGFGMENEHPMLTMPFHVSIGDQIFTGQRISVTGMEVEPLANGHPPQGSHGLATIQFPFEDFAINVMAKVSVPQNSGGTAYLLFSEPTGAHLAQLRYIMNSFIAGDLVTLKGMMAYTGPTQPKQPKGPDAKKPVRDRVRSIAVAIISPPMQHRAKWPILSPLRPEMCLVFKCLKKVA